jgi:hypothetical protein
VVNTLTYPSVPGTPHLFCANWRAILVNKDLYFL